MKIYAVLEKEDENNILYPSQISFSKEQLLLEINLITKYESIGKEVFYLGMVDLEENDICETDIDFTLLEKWYPEFETYGKWMHKDLNTENK